MKRVLFPIMIAVAIAAPAPAVAKSEVTSLPLDHPIAVAADGDHDLVFVSRGANRIAVVDGSRRQELATIAGPAGGSLTALAADGGTRTLFALDAANRTVVVIDEVTRQIIATVPVAAKPNAIAVNPATHRVYVTSTAPPQVASLLTTIDGAAPYPILSKIPMIGAAGGVAVDEVANLVYVSLNRPSPFNGHLGVLNAATNVPFDVPLGGTDLRGLAVDATTKHLLVADAASDQVLVSELTPFGLPGPVVRVAAGDAPTAVAADEQTGRIYVASTGTGPAALPPNAPLGALAILALGDAGYAVAEHLSLSRTSQALAVDTSNHRVFVANAGGPAELLFPEDPGSVSVVSRFEPPAHGFHFANAFKGLHVNVPHYGPVDLSTPRFGLCGGMVFAALDAYLAGGVAPPDTAAPGPRTALRAYLLARLIDSFDGGDVIARFLKWMALPVHSNQLQTGLAIRTGHEFVNRIHPQLLKGRPVPLGIVRVDLSRPIWDNHQELALRDFQDPATGAWVIEVYDPNNPDTTQYLWIKRRKQTSDRAGLHVVDGFRGFFAVPYSFEQPYWVVP
jgi:YVTN family beta-propeller protein